MGNLNEKIKQLKTLVKSAWPFRATRTWAWFFAVLCGLFSAGGLAVILKFLPWLVALAFFACAALACYLIASVLFQEDGDDAFTGI